MKSILQQQQRSSALIALVTIALGLVLMLWPDRSVSVICAILGGALLISGLLYVIGWFSGKRKAGAPVFMIIPGVILAGLGVWLMTSSQAVIALIQYVFGAVIIFHGVLDLQSVPALMQQKMPRWWIDLLLGALTLVLGLLILINPMDTFSALVALIGLALVYDGASDLWLILRLHKSWKTYLAFQNEEPLESSENEASDSN